MTLELRGDAGGGGVARRVRGYIRAMSETVTLTDFLMARINEEELLAYAFDEPDWLRVCSRRRRVVSAGDRHVLTLLGLLYLEHGDYRYDWLP